ncbi:MAG: hypothetical protein M3314_14390 [Actinomycetota bacterium]|nr:hypothetical protein [Actinomycetota bacterium]
MHVFAATDPDRPLDRLVNGLLDTFVYAPLGLALLAKDEIPKLAAQGRQRVEAQAHVARMVGQMAVAQGRRQVRAVSDRLTAPRGSDPSGSPTQAPARPEGRSVPVRDLGDERLPVPQPETLPDPAPDTSVATDSPIQPPPASRAAAEATAPSAADLPIPGYDSLSASQVVQRLPGLSPEELEAVRAYEQAGRARKTVLLRVAQLRAAS